ncbi:MAG TPA: PepSY-associated TM helix domain-containing protein [Minicystis sp.]|nr:PepSY-associated TM helix domain-containing protein [Minicystis sp.]
MADGSDRGSVTVARAPTRRLVAFVRGWVRALHRDMGYLAVGLTVVYALSGLAVNHVADWDPSFSNYERVVELGGPVPGSDDEAARAVLAKMHVEAKIRDAYRAKPDDLEITLDKRTLHVNTATGHVVDEGQEPRFFLRAANWLHENRGKKAWTRIADAYAVGLLLLALSGMFMLPGKKGLVGRGGVLVLLGALVPVAYVAWSGGPEAASGRPPPAAMRAGPP